MSTETAKIKIKSERLGSVQTVKQLLTDIENAYNSIYAFNFLVDTLSNDRDRQRRLLDEHFHHWRKYWREISMREKFPFDTFFYEFFLDRYFFRQHDRPINLIEFQSKLDIDRLVLPQDRLVITKINIQSPGFWEFLGSANPLQFIRDFIKDITFRNRQEKELGDLKILQEKIEILKDLDYDEAQIRQLVFTMITEPLNKISRHKDNGQIDGIDEE